MNESFLFWGLVAVSVFWAIGAYNRLMRLRSKAVFAFAALAAVYEQSIGLAKAQGQAAVGQSQEDPVQSSADDLLNVWQPLVAAADQFSASLKAAQSRPLDGLILGALATARATLDLSWARLGDLSPDLATQALSVEVRGEWEHLVVQAGLAQAEFDRRILEYNEAINQFPALLLAWIFDFKSTQSIKF